MLETLRAEGRLLVRAGRILRAQRGHDAVEVLIRDRHRQRVLAEQFDVLVRATGLETDVERTSHPLLAQLRDSGLVSADPLGLGVRASAQCELLDRRGMPVRGLYGLGPLLRGQSWEMTAVPELRIAARQLADHLLRRQRSASSLPQAALRARVG